MLDKVKESLGSAAGAVTSAAGSAASMASSLRDRLRARKHPEDKPDDPASAQQGASAEGGAKSRLASLATGAGAAAVCAAGLLKKGVGGLCSLAQRKGKGDAANGQDRQDAQAGEAQASSADGQGDVQGKGAFVKKTFAAAATGAGKAACAVSGALKHGAGAVAGLVSRKGKGAETQEAAPEQTFTAPAAESQAEEEARALGAKIFSASLDKDPQENGSQEQVKNGEDHTGKAGGQSAFATAAGALKKGFCAAGRLIARKDRQEGGEAPLDAEPSASADTADAATAAGEARDAASSADAFGAKMFSSALEREAQEAASGEGGTEVQAKAGKLSALLSAAGKAASDIGSVAGAAARGIGKTAGAAAGLLSRKGKKACGNAEGNPAETDSSSDDKAAEASDAKAIPTFARKACSAALAGAGKACSSAAGAVKKGLGAAGGLLSGKDKEDSQQAAASGAEGQAEKRAVVKDRLSALAAVSGKAASAAADSLKGGFGTLVKTIFSKDDSKDNSKDGSSDGVQTEAPADAGPDAGKPQAAASQNSPQDAGQAYAAGEADEDVQASSSKASSGDGGKGRFSRLLSSAGKACAGAAGSAMSVYGSLKDKFTTPKPEAPEAKAEEGAEASPGAGFSFAKAASRVIPSKQTAWKAVKSAASFVKGEAGKLARNLPDKEDFGKMKEGFAKLARKKAKTPRPEGPTQEEVWLGTYSDSKNFTSEDLARASAEASQLSPDVKAVQAEVPEAGAPFGEPMTTAETAPAAQEAPAEAAEPAPAVQETPAEAAETVPAEQEAPAEAAETVPAEQEAPAEAAETVPAEQEAPAEVAETAPVAQETPAEAAETASADQEAPAEAAEPAPADQEAPAEAAETASADQEAPAEAAETASADQATPAETAETASAEQEAPAETPEVKPAEKRIFGLFGRKQAKPEETAAGVADATPAKAEGQPAKTGLLAGLFHSKKSDGASVQDTEAAVDGAREGEAAKIPGKTGGSGDKSLWGRLASRKKDAEDEAPAGRAGEGAGEDAEAEGQEAMPARKGLFSFIRRKKKAVEPAAGAEGSEADADAPAEGETAEASEAAPAKKGFFGLYVRGKKTAEPAKAAEDAEGEEGEAKSSSFLDRFVRRRPAKEEGDEAPAREGFLAKLGIGSPKAAGEEGEGGEEQEKAPKQPSKYNPVRLAKHAGGILADGVTAVAKSVHPVEMMKSAGGAIVDGAHSVATEVKELKERIQPLERIRNAGYATIDGASALAGTVAGAVSDLADSLHRKATGKTRAEDEDAGAMPVQMAGDTARIAADTVVATGVMGKTITSMAASAVAAKAALPYLREAMALVLKDYGELKNLYFYRNTLKLAVKLKGIKEVLHVTVNETVVDEDCSTLTFRNFSCTITAVEKGLELLASQRCPIGMESPKAASILKGARWTGLVRQ